MFAPEPNKSPEPTAVGAAGFLIKGKARFVKAGPDFDFMKEKFSWLRATLAVTIETATQTW